MHNLHELPKAEELQYRIEQQLQYFKGNMPENYTAAWHGYLAGIFEWGVIDRSTYFYLESLLPRLSKPNPIRDIFIFEPDNSLLNN